MLKEQNISFKEYLGFKKEENKTIYLSPIDHYKTNNCIEATSKPNTIKLYSNRGGFLEIKDEEYYNISLKINPDIIVSLAEFPQGEGKKSHKRSIEKTITFLDLAIKLFRN